MSKVVKLIDYRHCNLGDAMTNTVIVDQLIQMGFAVCGGDIAELEACKNIKPDIVIVGGGGQIYETASLNDGSLYKRKLYELSKKYPVYFVGPGYNEFRDQNGIPILSREEIIVSQSEKYEQCLFDWAEVLKAAKRVSLRDRKSLEACRNMLNITTPPNKFKHYPDPSFLLADQLPQGIPISKRLVVYSVQPRKETQRVQLAVLQYLRDNKYQIIFMPHSHEDYVEYKRLRYDEMYSGIIAPLRQHPGAAVQCLQTAALHITSRLHGLVGSIVAGTPMLHIGAHQRKIQWQLEEIEYGHYKYVFNDSISPAQALKSIEAIKRESNLIREEFQEIAKKSAERARGHFEDIK